MMNFLSRSVMRKTSQVVRLASSLVVADINKDDVLTAGTLSTMTAAFKIGGDVSVLVMGEKVEGAARHASTIKGVSKVLKFGDITNCDGQNSENHTTMGNQLAKKFNHVLVPVSDKCSSNDYSSVLNRTIPHVTVIDKDSFKNSASVDKFLTNKFLLVRTESFEKVEDFSRNAVIEDVKLDTPAATPTKPKRVSYSEIQRRMKEYPLEKFLADHKHCKTPTSDLKLIELYPDEFEFGYSEFDKPFETLLQTGSMEPIIEVFRNMGVPIAHVNLDSHKIQKDNKKQD